MPFGSCHTVHVIDIENTNIDSARLYDVDSWMSVCDLKGGTFGE